MTNQQDDECAEWVVEIIEEIVPAITRTRSYSVSQMDTLITHLIYSYSTHRVSPLDPYKSSRDRIDLINVIDAYSAELLFIPYIQKIFGVHKFEITRPTDEGSHGG